MKKLFLLLVLSLSYVSCTDDNTEFAGNSTYVVGFQRTSLSQSYVATGDIVPLDVPVIFIGGQEGAAIGSDVTVSYEIDAASTAVEGDEYDLVNATNSVVLPSGITSTSIPFLINTGNLETGDENAKTIVINITTVVTEDDVVVASNFKKMTITLKGLCFSNLAGDYHITYTSGAVYPSIITKISDGNYRASYMPTFNAVYWFEFSDVCGVLTITNWQFQDTNPIFGTTTPSAMGVVNSNGSLTFSGVNVTGVATYVNRTWTLLRD